MAFVLGYYPERDPGADRALEVGDLLEAEVQANRIILTPKTVIDKGLKESFGATTASPSGSEGV